MATRLDLGGLSYLWDKIKAKFATKEVATTSDAGLMSASDKAKLDGIAAGAQVNSLTGVKGNAESSYRTGNVNLTAANVGAAISGYLRSSYNLDNLHTTGLYYANGSSATGFPQNGGKVYGGVINISNDAGSRTIQIVAGVFLDFIYYRRYISDEGGWSTWKQVTLT